MDNIYCLRLWPRYGLAPVSVVVDALEYRKVKAMLPESTEESVPVNCSAKTRWTLHLDAADRRE